MLAGDAAKLYDAVRTSGTETTDVAGAWASCRSASANPFFVAAFETKDKLKVVASGNAGLRELRSCGVCTPAAVLFGAFAFWCEGRQRFAFFSWCGAAVGGIAKGRMGLQKGAAAKAIDGCIADLRFTELAELEDAAVIDVLEKNSLRGVALAPP